MTSESLSPVVAEPEARADPVPVIVAPEAPEAALPRVASSEITPLVPAVVPVAFPVPSVDDAAGAVGLLTAAPTAERV